MSALSRLGGTRLGGRPLGWRRHDRRRPGALAPSVAALVLLAASGCAPEATDPLKPLPPATTAEEQASAILDRPRAPGEDNGLEVVRWSVSDNETLLRRAIGRYAVRDVPLGATVQALERHGFRAAVVRDADLPNFLIDVGGTTRAVAVWYGQVPGWREVVRTLLESPRVAMVDGRAERLRAGWLRIMVRAWTVPLEEGGVLELQLAPQLVGDTSEASGLQPGIGARDTLRGLLWPEASLHLELPRDTALVLLSAPAREDEEEEDPEGPPRRPEETGVGPLVELPPLLGELLLTDYEAKPPRRSILVLRARLPDILFADPLTSPGGRDPFAEGDGASAPPPDLGVPADAP